MSEVIGMRSFIQTVTIRLIEALVSYHILPDRWTSPRTAFCLFKTNERRRYDT